MKRLFSATPGDAWRAAPTARGRPSRRSERGFTLIELATVVIIIGIFAALAMPRIAMQLSDRHTHEAAQRIALTFQQARARAMGEGGAVLVRYQPGANGQGSFQTKEALVGTVNASNVCAFLPSSTCTGNWTDGDSQNRSIELYDLSTSYWYGNASSPSRVYATLAVPGSPPTTSPTMDVCFTPLGRAFVRYDLVAGVFVPLVGVPAFNVFRGTSSTATDYVGLLRRVLVLPTGIARLEL